LLFSGSVKDKDFYEEFLVTLDQLVVNPETTKQLLHSLLQRKKLKELSLLSYEAYEGKKDVAQVLELATKLANEPVEDAPDDVFVSDDIEFIVNKQFTQPGLRWRLNTLNKMLGSLRPGDFGFIFARPETGKTTLLCSELTYMAEQTDGVILWFANEEDGEKVMLRIYQAAFGLSLAEVMSDLAGWKQKFKEKFGGRLKIVMRQDLMTKQGVEKLCKQFKPVLVVLDQLSKIKGFDADRTDLELGAATTWSRELAKIIRAAVVAVHQADGTGEGVQWLGMNHVANAKTAMQADADWILGVGCQHKPGYETIRYLHLSKNKLTGDEDTDPGLRHGRCEVVIEPHRARYKDLMFT